MKKAIYISIKLSFLCVLFSSIFLLALISCSTPPKRSMLVTTVAQKAASRYETANNDFAMGNVESAGKNLLEAYNLATSIDNAALLSKICVSLAVYKMSVEKPADLENITDAEKYIFPEKTTYSFLDEARLYASLANDETMLFVADVYQVKADLLGEKVDYSKCKSLLDNAEKQITKDKYFLGYLYRTQGDLEFSKNNFSTAADYYVKAADIHFKNRYLYETSVDWYYASRAYSFAENKKSAIDAILKALQYDRDAENSAAIVADYRAYSKILLRGNPSESEKKQAQAVETRADEIEAVIRKK